MTKHPLFFLGGRFRKRSLVEETKRRPKDGAAAADTDGVQVSMEPEDVREERERVEEGRTENSAVVIKDLMKVFPPVGGNAYVATGLGCFGFALRTPGPCPASAGAVVEPGRLRARMARGQCCRTSERPLSLAVAGRKWRCGS